MFLLRNTSGLLRRCHWALAAAMLAFMFGVSITSMAHNSAIVDEVAHVTAAYSYDRFGDYRLNPEHPPLIKDLAGLPLQFMHLHFDTSPSSPWQTDTKAEWNQGFAFFYASGNNADAMLFWSRLPILLLSIAFGFGLYLYVRRKFGIATALLTLGFYCFSPNIIANDQLVTTDLGASIFIFISLVAYIRFAERPNRTNLLLLTLALMVAQLTKFNAFILYPFLGLVSLLQVVAWRRPDSWKQRLRTYTGGLILASIASLLLVWLWYWPQTINTPVDIQRRLIAASLSSGFSTHLVAPLQYMAGVPLLKPLCQYILGLLMVFGRVAGGNVTYFMGHITNTSFRAYFPVLIFYKTQVALEIIGLVTFGAGLVRFWLRRKLAWWSRVTAYVQGHFTETVMALFALFYLAISIAGNLNLGIRHVLPIYLPLFLLVALAVVRLGWQSRSVHWRRRLGVGLALLLAWYAAAAVWIYPFYLSYFNELMGGPGQAYAEFSDSSVDWGQSLLYLRDYINTHHLTGVGLDYFGGAVPDWYFCRHLTPGQYDCSQSPVVRWPVTNGPYTGKYLAVSETYLENDRYFAARDHRPGYEYLRSRQPIAKIGYSIYLFQLR